MNIQQQTLLPYDEAIEMVKKELNTFSFEKVISLKHSQEAQIILAAPNIYSLIGKIDNKKLIDIFLEVMNKTLLITPF